MLKKNQIIKFKFAHYSKKYTFFSRCMYRTINILKTILQHNFNAKATVKLFVYPLLTIILLTSTISSTFFIKGKQAPVTTSFNTSSSDYKASYEVAFDKVLLINNPYVVEIGDSDEECFVDDNVDDDFSSRKPANHICDTWPIYGFGKIATNKLVAFHCRSSIPLFILYHSWKNYLCS